MGGEGAPPWLGAGCAGAVGAPATRRSPGLPGSAAARPGRQGLRAVSPAPLSPGSLPLLVHSWVRQHLCCVCWKPCLSPARGAQFSPALEARPHPSFSLSSLTLMIQFRPSERCVEPRGPTRAQRRCTLSPCPSDAMCVGNTCDNMQLNTHTCTRRCSASPAAPWLCPGGFLPQDRLPLVTRVPLCPHCLCRPLPRPQRLPGFRDLQTLSSPRAGLTTTCSDN